MRRRMMMLAACVFFMMTLPGAACVSQALPVLTKVVSVLTNAKVQADRVDAIVQDFMRATNADEATRAEYGRVRDAVLAGIDTARAATEGATDLSQEDYVAAFAEFNEAWSHLQSFLQKTGALKGAKLSAGGTSGEVDMPEPLALKFKKGAQ